MKRALTFISGLLLSICFYMIFSLDSYAYTVVSGDTLGKIAADNGMTVEQLLQLNDIADPNLIFPGQEINLGKTENTDPYKRVNLTNDEKQLIKTLFDAEYYKNENPDVVAVYGEDPEKLFDHFLTYGLWETRQPNKDFNVNAYGSSYDDLLDEYKSDNLGKQVKDLYIHYLVYGKNEGREATIESCLGKGRDVYYYGAYEGSSEETAQEHVIAYVPKAESSSEPSSNPTPSAPVYSSFEEACNYYIHGMIERIVGLYEKYDLTDKEEYALHAEYLAKEVTTQNMSEWLAEATGDPEYESYTETLSVDAQDEYNKVMYDFCTGSVNLFKQSVYAGYSDILYSDYFKNIYEMNDEDLQSFFENENNQEEFEEGLGAYLSEDTISAAFYIDFYPAWIEDPETFVLASTFMYFWGKYYPVF